jgi:ABC-type polar amino acid transport system ATPase subunit
VIEVNNLHKSFGKLKVLKGITEKNGRRSFKSYERPAKEGMTMIVVTHEMCFAREVGSRVLFMDDGIVVERGTPQEIFYNAQNERPKSFLSKIL